MAIIGILAIALAQYQAHLIRSALACLGEAKAYMGVAVAIWPTANPNPLLALPVQVPVQQEQSQASRSIPLALSLFLLSMVEATGIPSVVRAALPASFSNFSGLY